MARVVVLSLSTVCSVVLAGCAPNAGEEGEIPPPPPGSVQPAPGSHAQLGSFVMRVRPGKRQAELVRISPALALAVGAPGVAPQNLDDLPITSDGSAGSGAPRSVELVTNPQSLVDTYGNAAGSGNCPGNAFCGDVTLTHFYPGLGLSAVYVKITAVTDANGNLLAGHGAANGASATPFGLDLKYGAWAYIGSLQTLAMGAGATKTWAINNPDDEDFILYLDAVAALYPMLWFDTSGITQTAPLLAGQPAIVHYVYARQTSCRGAGWSTQGYLKGANIDIHATSWPGVATDTYFDQQLVMPYGSSVDFWFNATDSSGCNKYDSANGNNFNYPLTGAAPALHFAGPSAQASPFSTSNWQVSQDAAVKAGATFTVDYELDRAQCVQKDRYGRAPADASVQMFYAFDGGAFTGVSLLGLPYGVPSAINGAAGQLLVPPRIAIPAGAHALTLYFEYSQASTGCHNYDSNLGANYHFTL